MIRRSAILLASFVLWTSTITQAVEVGKSVEAARLRTATSSDSVVGLSNRAESTAAITPTTPTSDFTDNGDGTVTHARTGLTWMRCSVGQTWTGATCDGLPGEFTWAAAMALTSTFAGKSDWRLPDVSELTSIVERASVNPAINSTVFPGTAAASLLTWWTSTVYASDPVRAWGVRFDTGESLGTTKTFRTVYVRLVRGKPAKPAGQAFTPNSDFTVNGQYVTHNKTGLTWDRCVMGQTYDPTSGWQICTGYSDHYTREEALALGGGGWRLPTVEELQTIVEYGDSGFNMQMFAYPHNAEFFWTLTNYVGVRSCGWAVEFSYGYTSYWSCTSRFSVRLVRGGKTPPTPERCTIASTPAIELHNPLANALLDALAPAGQLFMVEPASVLMSPRASRLSADGKSAIAVAMTTPQSAPVTFSVGPGGATGPAFLGSVTDFYSAYILQPQPGPAKFSYTAEKPAYCDAAGCVYLALIWAPVSLPAGSLVSGFQVTAVQGSSTATATFQLQPPPLLLVHGIWSSAKDAQFLPGTGGLRDWIGQRYQYGTPIDAVDYGPISHKSFGDAGVQDTFHLALASLLTKAASQSVVARQADVVAHSMGGLVTRFFMSNAPAYSLVPPTPIHKVVTIGTPHDGSPLAARLLAAQAVKNVATAEGGAFGSMCVDFKPPIDPCTLGGIFKALKRPIDTGVQSLAPGSGPLRALSTANEYQAIVATAPVGTLSESALNFVLRGFLTGESIATIINTTPSSAHDTIVPTSSQGKGARGTTAIGNTVHANVYPGDDHETTNHDAWTAAFIWLTGLQPSPGFADWPLTVDKDPATAANLDLTGYTQVPATNVSFTPANNSPLIIGTPANITASSSTKAITQFLLFQASTDPAAVAFNAAVQSPFSVAFMPAQLGSASFVALVKFADQTYAVAPLIYNVQANGAPTKLTLGDDPTRKLRAGMMTIVRASARYGTDVDVTDAATYSIRSGTSSVIDIGPGGFVSGKGKGSDWLDVSYLGLKDSIQFFVNLLPPSGLLNIDANDSYDALTDGLVILRYLFGLTGASLTNGALGPGALIADANAIVAKLNASRQQLDVDGNGQVDALTDGLLVLRYLFGLRGQALTAGAVGFGATRNGEQIETYIQSLMPVQ